MNAFIDDETLGRRVASCGHCAPVDWVVEDRYYGDALCAGCLKKRAEALRAAGDYESLSLWKRANAPEPVLSGALRHVVEYPVVTPTLRTAEREALPAFDPEALPDEARGLLLSCTAHIGKEPRITVRNGFGSASYTLPLARNPVAGRYVLTDAAYTEALPRMLFAWKTKVERLQKQAALEEELPDLFWERAASRLRDAIERHANGPSPEMPASCWVRFFPEREGLHRTASRLLTPEEAIQVLMPSTTMLEGRAPDMHWSGTAWRATERYFVTCAHVVNPENTPGYDMREVELFLLTNNYTYVPCRAAYINYDLDAAIVEIRPEDVNQWGPPLALGDSDALTPGDQIVTVGAPEGVAAIASVGYVASTERHIPELVNNVVFVDLDVFPGSSGGPIANMRGEVIGIVRGSHGRGEANDLGLNYAVPVNPIRRWLDLRVARV